MTRRSCAVGMRNARKVRLKGNSIEIELTIDLLSNFTCWLLISRELKIWNKKQGGHRIRLGAGGPSINSIIPEIICFQKRSYLNHSPDALGEQKNREGRKLSEKDNNGCIASMLRSKLMYVSLYKCSKHAAFWSHMLSFTSASYASNIAWWPNILPFGHLVWCFLIVFDRVWSCLKKFEGHQILDQTT